MESKKDLYKTAKELKRSLKLKHLISLYNKKELIEFIDNFKNKIIGEKRKMEICPICKKEFESKGTLTKEEKDLIKNAIEHFLNVMTPEDREEYEEKFNNILDKLNLK